MLWKDKLLPKKIDVNGVAVLPFENLSPHRDNSFFVQQLALASAMLREKETALMQAKRASALLPSANDPLSGLPVKRCWR